MTTLSPCAELLIRALLIEPPLFVLFITGYALKLSTILVYQADRLLQILPSFWLSVSRNAEGARDLRAEEAICASSGSGTSPLPLWFRLWLNYWLWPGSLVAVSTASLAQQQPKQGVRLHPSMRFYLPMKGRSWTRSKRSSREE